jgi:hypothetical protein
MIKGVMNDLQQQKRRISTRSCTFVNGERTAMNHLLKEKEKVKERNVNQMERENYSNNKNNQNVGFETNWNDR